MTGTALGEPRSADFVASTALGEPRSADFVAGAALGEPRSADFVTGSAQCEFADLMRALVTVLSDVCSLDLCLVTQTPRHLDLCLLAWFQAGALVCVLPRSLCALVTVGNTHTDRIACRSVLSVSWRGSTQVHSETGGNSLTHSLP